MPVPANNGAVTQLDTVEITGQKPGGSSPGSSNKIGVLSALGGDILSAGLNLYSQHQAQRYNSKEADKARAYNTMMWEKQNAYNHPMEQMRRLREAGLNPNLMYGLPSSTASLQSSSAQGSSGAQNFKFDNMANVQMLINQTKIAEAQANNLNADAELKITEKNRVEADTARIREDTSRLATYNSLGVQETEQNRINQEIKMLDSQMKNLDEKTLGQEIENNLAKDSYQDRLKSYRLQNNLTQAQASKEYQLANLYAAQILMTNEETRLIGKKIITETERATGEYIGNEIKHVELRIKELERDFDSETLQTRISNETVNYLQNTINLGKSILPSIKYKKGFIKKETTTSYN